MKHRNKTLCLIIGILLQSCNEYTVSIDDAVRQNQSQKVEEWLHNGGNPDLVVDERSLLHIATGPNGGTEVIELLLKFGADPDLGDGFDSPLVNSAMWVSLENCKILIKNGAEASTIQSAIDAVGDSGGPEVEVINYLKVTIQQ